MIYSFTFIPPPTLFDFDLSLLAAATQNISWILGQMPLLQSSLYANVLCKQKIMYLNAWQLPWHGIKSNSFFPSFGTSRR